MIFMIDAVLQAENRNQTKDCIVTVVVHSTGNDAPVERKLTLHFFTLLLFAQVQTLHFFTLFNQDLLDERGFTG